MLLFILLVATSIGAEAAVKLPTGYRLPNPPGSKPTPSLPPHPSITIVVIVKVAVMSVTSLNPSMSLQDAALILHTTRKIEFPLGNVLPWGVLCAACDCTNIPTTNTPVCASDGATYGNECIAQCANVLIVSDGTCPYCEIKTNSASLSRADSPPPLPELPSATCGNR